MGFFKEFKEDLSQAVNDLVTEPELENAAVPKSVEDDVMVNTLDDPELAQMAASFEKQAMEEMESTVAALTAEVNTSDSSLKDEESSDIADETAIITQGLTVTGDLMSKGSIDIFGSVIGNVGCNGKLTVSGMISGDSKANEIFANDAKIDGNLEAKGSIKIGQGSVVVGNINATSAVIAGAVKGDIDVKGPVIVDASAIIVGDIKSKTVQINNGATIDGRCSQCYADVNTAAIFDIKAK